MPTASEVVARVEAAPLPARSSAARPRGPIATCVLIGIAGRAGDRDRSAARPDERRRRARCAAARWCAASSTRASGGGSSVACSSTSAALHLLVNVIGLCFARPRLRGAVRHRRARSRSSALAGIAGAVASYSRRRRHVGRRIGRDLRPARRGVRRADVAPQAAIAPRGSAACGAASSSSRSRRSATAFLYPVIDQWAQRRGLRRRGVAVRRCVVAERARGTRIAMHRGARDRDCASPRSSVVTAVLVASDTSDPRRAVIALAHRAALDRRRRAADPDAPRRHGMPARRAATSQRDAANGTPRRRRSQRRTASRTLEAAQTPHRAAARRLGGRGAGRLVRAIRWATPALPAIAAAHVRTVSSLVIMTPESVAIALGIHALCAR